MTLMSVDHTWYEKPAGIRVRPSAGGVVARMENGRILIALAREKGLAGYVLPKGGREPGEDVDSAARREIAEEVGLTRVRRLADLAVLERLESERRFWSVIDYGLYLTDQVSGPIGDPENHPGMAWCDLDRLPDLFWPDERELLEAKREFIRQVVMNAHAADTGRNHESS
ncbi:MAG TPA: NUDIX hydrolase [Candidatus Hydrogenedentes bacterium]|nr:NUDIX hydrolase [Candidatus Hydrogenedentota bacterium]